jgi:cytochrome c
MTRRTRLTAWLLLAATSATTPSVASADPPTPSIGAPIGEIAAGAELAELCARCHALRVGEESRWGPDLVGIVDRPMGAEPNYPYGSYLRARKEEGATWDDAALRAWLVDSKAVARAAEARTKMPAQELTDDQLDVLLPYLRGLK